MYPQEYNLPVFIGSGAVLTSGSTDQLVAGQLGIFDAKTGSTLTGAAASNQALLVAEGSWHTKSKLNKFVGNLQTSDKTIDFLGKDILEFQRSAPRVAQSEQWIIGWDGVSNETLSFKCGKDYDFRVKVWGEDVYGTFLRPVDRFIRVRTKCCADGDCATTDCSDSVAGKEYAKQLAKAINEDPELKYFVKAEVISSDYSAASITHHLYHLSVTDAGDQAALSFVQTAYPALKVSRISRVGLVSVYEICQPSGDSAPSNFTPISEIKLAACDGTCPAGFTAIFAKDVYVVNRPLAGTENLVGGTAQQTFADVVKLSYFAAHTFNGATAVDPSTDQITVVAHGFAVNTPVVYSNGGGTSITPLVSGTTYYVKTVVDANNVTLSATPGGAVIDITVDGVGASQTLTVSSAAKFLSQDGAVARIQIKVDAATADLIAILSDSLVKVAITEAVCTPPAASAIVWVYDSASDDRYKSTRTLSLTLEKECGTATRLADIKAFYASDSSIDASSIAIRTSGTCSDIYEMDQYSKDCSVDSCLSEAEVFFDEPQSFGGFSWIEDAPAAGSLSTKVGVRVTAAYEDTRFGGCSFNPSDYYSVRPLKLEIHEFDDSGAPCPVPVPSRKVRANRMATQSGEWVIRQFINSNKYRAFGEFYLDPRLREVLDANIHEVVDTKKSYKLYFLKVRQNRAWQNHAADFSPEIFEFMFAFPEGTDTTAFEAAIEKVTSQFGVFLQDR